MRVLLADDHALFRDSLAALLRTWNVEVVGEAGDGEQAVAAALAVRPDVVLMDIRMPRMDGLEATRRIKAVLPDTRIVFLTMSDEERDLFEGVKAGGEGYLLKNMGGAEFGDMLAGLARNEPPVSRSLAGKLLREFGRQARGEPTSHTGELTEREKEVLQLVAHGVTSKEAGRNLGISERTVNYHVKNILAKLHARNRAEAAVKAFQEGFVESDSEP